ncbi:hypothetical protein ANN_13904 [Periplaneta americana]|uniref:Uncharacterized protein n=1 Tax=Periplaneta americana TaxID=6978 RepID=A0ABQ8SUU4_PERAM|nr:hypothetical protein ANN_13904 [Periplaneta americana]
MEEKIKEENMGEEENNKIGEVGRKARNQYAIRKVQDNRKDLEKFKYLIATATNISGTPREIKRRINMGNACYYSVEKLLSSSLLLKNLKVRIYKTVILPDVLYGGETWALTLREEQRLRAFENKVLRKIFEVKRNEVTGEWRKLHNTELQHCILHLTLLGTLNPELDKRILAVVCNGTKAASTQFNIPIAYTCILGSILKESSLKDNFEAPRPGKKIILQHDNAWPHTDRVTVQKNRTFWWEALLQSLYSADLAPSDCHLFGSVKEQLRGQLQKAERQCLREDETDFYLLTDWLLRNPEAASPHYDLSVLHWLDTILFSVWVNTRELKSARSLKLYLLSGLSQVTGTVSRVKSSDLAYLQEESHTHGWATRAPKVLNNLEREKGRRSQPQQLQVVCNFAAKATVRSDGSCRPLAQQVLNVNRPRQHATVSPYSQKEKKNNELRTAKKSAVNPAGRSNMGQQLQKGSRDEEDTKIRSQDSARTGRDEVT